MGPGSVCKSRTGVCPYDAPGGAGALGQGASPHDRGTQGARKKETKLPLRWSDLEPAPGWNKKVILLVTYYRILKNVGAGGDFRDPFVCVLAQSLEHSRCPQKVYRINEWVSEWRGMQNSETCN